MGRGATSTYFAGLALAMVLGGCGGGSRLKTSTGATAAPSTTFSSTVSPAPATTPKTAATNRTSAAAYWPYTKLLARLAGRTVGVSNATVRLDPSLIECNGDGAPRSAGSAREWSRYTCTQTIFQGGGDHDVTFEVIISSPTQLTVSSARSGAD